MDALTWIAVILACAVFGPTLLIGGLMVLAAAAKHRSDKAAARAVAEYEKTMAEQREARIAADAARSANFDRRKWGVE
jgi:hypothetical protein